MSFDMYREIILDHYKNPRNFGDIKNADTKAEKKNTLCGDLITISLKLGPGNRITDIKFGGAGCSVSRAGGSILTGLVKGKKISEVEKYTDQQFIKDMGVPIMPARKRCALLALETLRAALKNKKSN